MDIQAYMFELGRNARRAARALAAAGTGAKNLALLRTADALLAQAEREGAGVVHGLPRFVHQACAQFELWTGRRFPLDRAMTLLEETLAGRSKT